MRKDKQELPEWFRGVIYNMGDTVINPLTGESVDLNAVELSIYVLITRYQHIMEVAPRTIMKHHMTSLEKGLGWFKKNNPGAYMALLN